MGNKYTPGPWRLDPKGFIYPDKWSNYTVFALAKVSHDEEEGYDRIANGRLLAAAPEMYELLEDFEVIFPSALHNGHHDLVARLKNILKKIRSV